MSTIHQILLLFLFTIVSCSPEDGDDIDPDKGQVDEVTLKLVDDLATEETKALYANLWNIQSKGIMFGHHDGLIYGRDWVSEPGRSDVKEVCGDYPAVFSVDFAQIMDDRKDNGQPLNAATTEERRSAILAARARGEVITACIHINNPLTGGDSWDNSDKTVVKQILEREGEVSTKYKLWLDNLADFVNNLRDDNGKLIPIIFRPYHEHTQTWSWWSKFCTTEEEFIGLWRFTIDYLKDEKDVHNLIYAISPQLDAAANINSLLFRWPGDDYVDFIGMDSYNGTNTNALATNASNLALLSEEKKKPCGITEIGIEGIRNGGSEYAEYWTEEILKPLAGEGLSLVVMWRNKYDPTHNGHHFYGPYINHSSASNFVTFYESSFTIFSKDLPDMYSPLEHITVK